MHRLLAIAALVLSFGISSAEAAKRVALVIGNNSYKTLPDLDNARKDADGIASKLRSLGWDVVLKKDLSRRQAYRQIATFESKLRDAEVGLVYYAGHGIQKDGKNYLIPSDAEIEVEEDLRSEAFTSSDILEAMEKAGAPMNIVILDSCRDNPLPRRSRSAERGLAAPSLPAGIKGTAIVFSAGPGQVAMDGPKNGHGVFTGELLKVLDRPGLKLEEVFKQTARQVAVRTNSKQKPWMNSSVTSDFYFQEEKATPAASVPAADKETVFWQSIANSDRAGDYKAYLSQYPSGAFAALARSRLSALKETKTASLSPPNYTIEAMDETLVALRSANVRERPTTSSAKLATLKSGFAVEVTGKTQFEGKDWYRIAMSGRSAYVFGSLLGEKATPVVGVYPSLAPGKTFRDCADCPEMVVIPSGSFRMGDLSGGGYKYEKPVHKVRIGYSFAVGKYEVTRGEFAKFITETGYDAGNSCYVWSGTKWESRSGKTWRDPGYSQTDRDPVACVSWDDVKAYVDWMSRKSGKEYRLLHGTGWEYVEISIWCQ